MAKISVIIPIYNASQYLEQCLDSIAGQTLRDIEIICVDDGSTDASADIIKEYQKIDNRIIALAQENAGAGAARNTGMAAATGDYLSFLDADDFFEPDMLEKAYERAEQTRADFIVFHSDQYFTEDNRFSFPNWVVRDEHIPPYETFSYRQLTDNIFKVFVGWAWDKLYRSDFVKAHGLRFQEQRTTNDMLFVFSALFLAKKISVCQDILIHQRRDAKDSISKTRENSWWCFYDALSALRDRLNKEGKYKELERDLINYALHAVLWNYNTLAEPTKTMLKEKLNAEWFKELGISDKDADYYYNRQEYLQYIHIS